MAGNRPTGISVLAVLTVLGSLAGLYNGSLYLSGGEYLTSLGVTGYDLFFYAEGVVGIVFAIWGLLVGYSFWTAKPWGWTSGVAYTIVGLVNGVIIVAVLPYGNVVAGIAIGFIIDLIVLVYLFRGNVKAYFGRGMPVEPMAPPPPPPPA